jgi:hypothetical protein
MPNFYSTDDIVGNWLIVIATSVSILGVVYNNVLLNHVAAMQWWGISNIMFAGFFYGQYKGWWNGGLPSAILCGFYIFCFITGVWGLMQP